MQWPQHTIGGILKGMQSTHRGFLRTFSVAVLGTIFLCQVIGSLCPMAAPGPGTTVTIHQAHAEHTMGTSNMCQESLPSSSSPKSFEATVLLLPVLDSSCGVVTQAGLRGEAAGHVLPLRSGPPLYTYLSTFRI